MDEPLVELRRDFCATQPPSRHLPSRQEGIESGVCRRHLVLAPRI
jgi:hypothetical protein